MERFDTLVSKLTAIAYLLGPALLLISITMYAFGIGLNSDGFSSYVEGVIGVYALVFFVLIYLDSAKIIGKEKAVYGFLVYVFGLIGACGGVFAMGYRVVIGSLDKSGMPASVMANYMLERESHWEMLVMAPATISFPITSILIGVGLIIIKTHSFKRFVGPLLVIAGIAFLLAQGTESDWGLTYFYPLSGILWLIAFGSIGTFYLSSENR